MSEHQDITILIKNYNIKNNKIYLNQSNSKNIQINEILNANISKILENSNYKILSVINIEDVHYFLNELENCLNEYSYSKNSNEKLLNKMKNIVQYLKLRLNPYIYQFLDYLVIFIEKLPFLYEFLCFEEEFDYFCTLILS